jgi:hypothetical protein
VFIVTEYLAELLLGLPNIVLSEQLITRLGELCNVGAGTRTLVVGG